MRQILQDVSRLLRGVGTLRRFLSFVGRFLGYGFRFCGARRIRIGESHRRCRHGCGIFLTGRDGLGIAGRVLCIHARLRIQTWLRVQTRLRIRHAGLWWVSNRLLRVLCARRLLVRDRLLRIRLIGNRLLSGWRELLLGRSRLLGGLLRT